jgi:hypothetical protein
VDDFLKNQQGGGFLGGVVENSVEIGSAAVEVAGDDRSFGPACMNHIALTAGIVAVEFCGLAENIGGGSHGHILSVWGWVAC